MTDIILITSVTLIASTISSMSGFGFNALFIGVLSFFFPLEAIILLSALLHIGVGISKLIIFKKQMDWLLLLFFGGAGMMMSFLGAKINLGVDPTLFLRSFGVFLILYVAYVVFKPSFALPKNPLTKAIGGACFGFTAGFFGIGGPTRTLFLSAFNLNKHTYLFTGAAIALLSDIVRSSMYLQNMAIPSEWYHGAIFFLGAVIAGTYLGKICINHIPQSHFRQAISVFLFLIAIKFLIG